MGVHRQHQHVGVAGGRRRAGLCVSAAVDADERLLRWPSAGSQPLCREPGCLDVRTGGLVWYFQAVHHGVWEYDFPGAPNLVDITVDGRPIKAVAIASKQAFTYVFDRETGEPVWPIEERPVPKGDVPGEWCAETQPFPTKPPAFDQQGVTIDDLIDFTPELRQEAIAILDDYAWGPIFTPPVLIDDRQAERRGHSSCPVWLVAPTGAAPISYRVDGKQYIVVAVGWDDMPSEYVALALP